ncbi:MAG: hypothetical protein IT223_12860 [Crocinitomicaceae bacterium]|nr:hypothetical protein [Crocinitomicaceae bacterium]
MVQNPQAEPVPAVFSVVLTTTAGANIATSSSNETPVIIIPPGSSLWNLFDLIPFQAFHIDAENQELIIQTGQLPEDSYQLCVTALTPEFFQPISPPACTNFFIQNYLDPVAVNPTDGAVFSNVNEIVFQWTPVLPSPPFPELYEIKVVQVYSGQVVQEALQINPPFFQTVSSFPSIGWPPELQMPQGTTLFVWTVTPLQSSHLPYTMPTGSSVPFTFSYSSVTDLNCESFTISGWDITINGIPSTGGNLTAGDNINVWPVAVAVCSDGITPAIINGHVEIVYSDTTGHQINYSIYSPEETIVLPGPGTFTASFTGFSSCGTTGTICDPSGMTTSTGPVSGSHETIACACTGCTVNVEMLVNGSPYTTGEVLTCKTLSFNVTGDISCNMSGCPKNITEKYVTISYTNSSGQIVIDSLTANETVVIPTAQYFVFTGHLRGNCTDSPGCHCESVPAEMYSGIPENTGGGETTAPPEKVPGETVACACGCKVSLIWVIDGVAYDDSIPDFIGKASSFIVEGDISCTPSGCQKVILEKSVMVSFTDANGNSVSKKMNSPDETIIIPEFTSASITAFLKGSCSGTVCSCISNIELVPTPGGGKDRCLPPVFNTDPATPVSLGMTLEAPELAPYPRAVPLKALGSDFDMVHFLCTGCSGGEGKEDYPVEDRMMLNYQWELKSPLGSLNDPFRVDSINKVDSTIMSVLRRLDEIGKERIYISERLSSGIAADSLKYTSSLGKAEKIKNEADSLLSLITIRMDSLLQKIGETNALLADIRILLQQKNDSLDQQKNQIDTLQFQLTNPPSAEEAGLLTEVNALREIYMQKQSVLLAYEDQLTETSLELAEQVEVKNQLLQSALNIYYSKRDQANAKNQQIIAMETQLFAQPLSKNFIQSRRRLGSAINILLGNYPPVASISSAINNQLSEVKAKSLSVVAAQPELRAALYNQFAESRNQLVVSLNQCCSGLTPQPYADCNEKKSAALVELGSLDSSVVAIISAQFVFPAGIIEDIEQLRNELVALETQVNTLDNTAKQASENYLQSVEIFADEMAEMEQQKILMSNALVDSEQTLLQKENLYIEAKKQREADFELNKTSILEILHNANMLLTTLEHGRELCEDSLISLLHNLDLVQADYISDSLLIVELNKKSKQWNTIISNLNEKLSGLNKERTNHQEQLKKLEKEEKELKSQLEELEKTKSKLLQPTKTATGPIVYYIPPPLEEVMKYSGKYPEFEEYIKNYESAKAAYEMAFAKKKERQAIYTKEVLKISKLLAGYKTLSSSLEEANASSLELEQEVGLMEGEFLVDYNETKEKLESLKTSAESSLDSAVMIITEIESAKADVVEELDLVKQQYEAAQLEYTGLSIQWQDKIQLRNNVKGIMENSSAELKSLSAEYDKNEKDKTLKEIELDKARQSGTIAAANENDASAATAKNQINQLSQQLEAIGNHLNTLQQQLQQKTIAHSDNVFQFRQLDSLANVTREQRNKAYHTTDSLHIFLDSLNNKISFYDSGKNHFTLAKNKAEQLIKKIDEKLEDFSSPAAEAMNEEEDIQGKKEELEDAQKLAETLSEELEASVTKINASVSEKKKTDDAITTEIEVAKKKMEDEEKKLSNFIHEQFIRVKFDADIELKGEDEVADGWRSKDGEQRLVKTIRYNSSRTPSFDNEYPSGGLIAAKVPAVCIPDISFQAPPQPGDGSAIVPVINEPRTIALIYKEGRLLWPEWPVIPEDAPPLLAKDVVPALASFPDDNDLAIYKCSAVARCTDSPPLTKPIVDTGYHNWLSEKGKMIGDQSNRYSLWEAGFVPKPEKSQKQKVEAMFNGAKIIADNEVKGKAEPVVFPGVMIEVTDTLTGVPGGEKEVTARVITGDHSGLQGEDIEFSCKLIGGESAGYGFSNDTLIKIVTDGGGYAKTMFNFGDGFAKFRIIAKWKRGENVIAEDEFVAIAPLITNGIRIANTPYDAAWNKAIELFSTGEQVSSASLQSIAGDFPDCSEENETACDNQMRGIAGLLNHQLDFVNDEYLNFSTETTGIHLIPEKEKTHDFGIAVTVIDGIGEDQEITLLAKVDEKYKDVGAPAEDSIGYSSKKIEEFRIGIEENYFTIVLDEPAEKGVAINGTGKIKMPEEGIEAMVSGIIDLTLSINEVEVEGEDTFTATIGNASWVKEDGWSTTQLGFTLTLDSLFIYAERGAGIGGNISHASLNQPAAFYAEISPSGDFLGTIANLPSIAKAGFRLEEGASVTIDMHDNASPPGLEEGFRGIYIGQATLQLPDVFKRSEDNVPTAISVKNFSIGNTGLSGKVQLEGDLVKMGYAGFAFEAKELSVIFENSSLTAASFTGEFAFTGFMDGSVISTIELQGESFHVDIKTGNTVYIPRLKTAFALQSGTGFSWDDQEELGTFKMNATINSEHFDPITITGFEVNSKWEIKADAISVNAGQKFGGGFSVFINTIGFSKTEKEYTIVVAGKFGFPVIPELNGTITISPGPEVSVAINGGIVEFDYGPVSFKGGFKLSASEFRGEFAIGIDKVIENGLDGLFIIGNQKTNETQSFTYWYVELSAGVKIPIGQTGLSILKVGGGIGSNFAPPVGDQEGAPVNNYGAFSFKAIIGMGNTPNGEVFEGRMEMVYQPSKFSLYGKVWLLKMEENMFGEGQLDLCWGDNPKIEGFVRMYVALPDAEGKVMQFDGKIKFLYQPDEWYVRSEKIEGSLLREVHANAVIDITGNNSVLDGDLYYKLDKKIDVAVFTLGVMVDVSANAHIDYDNNAGTMNANAVMHGSWSVTAETTFGNANLVSGAIDLALGLAATPSQITASASASISWDIWMWSGSQQLDLGYTASL